ncbi:SDR family oxidoreductase [Dongia rigui]|uniref:SDR family oxidoreductase n=1 Tax=Dongia rigui TaxID=940149 RepID=A0ABU5E487_9PROT|nr:SDR family oxidoreductase [Dongia rigui]MDY0874455.1 SDR family oxidoreductase [Dongia rigui]
MPTVLITGANRGIGLELTRQYASAGWDVIACCRKPKEAGELTALKVEVKALDVADAASIKTLATDLKGRSIDVLLNNAGILGRRIGFGHAEPDEFLELQRVNALAPLLIAEAFVAHVTASGQKKIAAITSGLASITNVNDAASYAYRASKASLNMVMRKLDYDLKDRGIVAAAISPGWVQTDMGGTDAALKVEDSAAGIIKVIAGLDAAKGGGFFGYDGETIPW